MPRSGAGAHGDDRHARGDHRSAPASPPPAVKSPLSADEVKEQAEAALGVAPDKLAKEDFAFATSRLEELGLIDCLDAASSVQ